MPLGMGETYYKSDKGEGQMKIVVLAGGLSPEREVSLCSGAMIANALMEQGHEVCLLDSWLGVKADEVVCFKRIEDGEQFFYEIGTVVPDLEALKGASARPGIFGNRVEEICRLSDVVFLALHGGAGENGQIQACLEAGGIAFTGSGYEGSLKAMDKHVSKLLMRDAGILTPDWRLYREGDGREPLDFPCVVKPCCCGSSLGVAMVENQREWKEALCKALSFEPVALAEKRIVGREFSVGVLGGVALPVIEVIPKTGFYDYENKYQRDRTVEVCPAELGEREAERMKGLAVMVHEVLGLGYYSRVDFMMDGEGGIYCLEANSLPGMTPLSLLPQEAAAAGICYGELCERIAVNGKGVLG